MEPTAEIDAPEPHEHDAAGCLDCGCWASPLSSRVPCTCPYGVRSDMRVPGSGDTPPGPLGL